MLTKILTRPDISHSSHERVARECDHVEVQMFQADVVDDCPVDSDPESICTSLSPIISAPCDPPDHLLTRSNVCAPQQLVRQQTPVVKSEWAFVDSAFTMQML